MKDTRRGFLGKLITGAAALVIARRLPDAAETEPKAKPVKRESWSSPQAKDPGILRHVESYSGNRLTDARIILWR